jgi:hypothetical protein
MERCLVSKTNQEANVKLLLIGAALGATLLTALPVAAQVVVRTPGVGVVVRDGDRDGYRHRDRSWRRHHADCRTIRTRTRLPNGNVIVKTRQVCR